MVWLRTENPTDIWRHLQISGGIFRYLRASSDIFRYHPHINEILTCHMEYTESLPPPPGTHEAWPTKPRSVSHWPGLAGLKAGRLSAGRPGRLRTLRGITARPAPLLARGLNDSKGTLDHHQEKGSYLVGRTVGMFRHCPPSEPQPRL